MLHIACVFDLSWLLRKRSQGVQNVHIISGGGRCIQRKERLLQLRKEERLHWWLNSRSPGEFTAAH